MKVTPPRALIVGAAGQDGRLLAAALAADGAAVHGIVRGQPPLDDRAALARVVAAFAPTQVYYLAAHHHSAEDRAATNDLGPLVEASVATHVTGFANMLDAVERHAPAARVFYAASSHVFGVPPTSPQDERTPFAPRCVYGLTKVAGIELARVYRTTRGVAVSAGILYNHESPLRRPGFLSQKLVRGAVSVAAGEAREVVVGNLAATVDWSWAEDTVRAMRAILDAPEPGEFVVASGRAHTVADFARHAFAAVGLDWRDHVRQSGDVVAKPHVTLIGDPTRLRSVTGWRPTLDFEGMVTALVRAELARTGFEPQVARAAGERR